MFDRFLRLFLLFFLTGSSSLVLLSCSTSLIEEKDDVTDEQRDLEKFNEITGQFRKKLAKKFSSVIETTYEVEGENHKELKSALEKGSKLTDAKISDSLKNDDGAIKFFQDKFVKVLEEVNTEIANDNSNIYVNSLPARFLSSQTEMSVNLVKVAVLEDLAREVKGSTLKITRLDVKFNYELSFKKLSPQQESYSFNISLTNNSSIHNDVQQNISEKMNRIFYSVLKDYEVINDSKIKSDGYWNKYFANNQLDTKGLMNEYFKLLTTKVSQAIKNDSLFGKYEAEIESNSLLYQINIFYFELGAPISNIYEEFFVDSKIYKNAKNKKLIIDRFMETIFKKWYRKKVANELLLDKTSQKFDLSKVFVAGLKLSGFLNDSNNKNFSFLVYISVETIEKNVQAFVECLVSFFVHYDGYVAIKDAIFTFIFSVNDDILKIYKKRHNVQDVFEKLVADFTTKNSLFFFKIWNHRTSFGIEFLYGESGFYIVSNCTLKLIKGN